MFGYIRPYKPEMLVRQYDLYKSVYCGLCKQLSRDYGIFSKMILSYDSTFFAMVYSGVKAKKEPMNFCKKSCTCNPLKKCCYFVPKDDSLSAAAAFSVISFYFKLKDNIADDSFFKKISAWLLLPMAALWRKKAVEKYPLYDSIVEKMLNEQFAVEKESPSVDRAADSTAKMLSEIMALSADNEEEKLIYSRFGYFLGRWIYLIDAIDDFDKDLKSGGFNPLLSHFSDKAVVTQDDEFKCYCNNLLNQTLVSMTNSYNLIEINNFSEITDHIVNVGMPMMQKAVIFDRKVNKRK